MKLYFYFLNEKEMTMEYCEVEAKTKTYIPVNKFPETMCRSRILKNEIGKVLYGYYFSVVLDKRDDKKAKTLFREYFEREILSSERRIEILKNRLKIVEEFESEE